MLHNKELFTFTTVGNRIRCKNELKPPHHHFEISTTYTLHRS